MAGAREQMIDAAERIAAERGMGSMSLREVQAASGQRNKSAAQYHFGSREGLIEAVVAARMGPINEQRLELLSELCDPPDMRSLVEALVLPLAGATVGRPGSHWARFLFQGWADPGLHDVVRRSFEASSFRTVRDLLIEALVDLPRALRRRRVDQMLGLVLMSLAAEENAISRGRTAELGPSAQVDDLVDVCCGVLATAPTSDLAGRRAGRP